MSKKGTFLRSSEWLLTGSLSLLFLSLIAISKIRSSQLRSDLPKSLPIVEVVIEGFVAKPGAYPMVVGTPLEEALQKARPHRFANLREIDGKMRVREPLRLEIAKLETVKILLEGAVANPGMLEVPAGTRVCELKKVVSLLKETDLSFFKKRRFLEDGEVVCVPRKNG